MTSQSIEDYIKAIFQVDHEGSAVSTSALADRLDVRPASVSSMLRRLERLGLIRYEPYHGASLTAKGEKLARRMLRRHRLIERFLTEFLDYPWDAVHDEAERLEHAVSARFIEAIDRVLESPLTDPHGDPIPSRDGAMDDHRYPSLAELETGTRATVRRVSDMDPALLRHYRSVGLEPDAELRVEAVDDEGLTVVVEGASHLLSRRAAEGVFVERSPAEAPDG